MVATGAMMVVTVIRLVLKVLCRHPGQCDMEDMAGIHLLLVMSSDKVRAYYCSLTVGTGLQLLHSLVFKFDDARGFQALGSVINSPIHDTTMLGLSVMHALRGCLSISTRKRVSSLVLSHWKICWRCHMARFLQCLAIWSM